MIRVQLVKSINNRPPKMRKTVKALGLTKRNSVVEFKTLNPALEGMINTAKAVLKMEKIND